jgi:hypothetical protein
MFTLLILFSLRVLLMVRAVLISTTWVRDRDLKW